MRWIALVGAVVCAGGLGACSVPDVVFTSDDGGAYGEAASDDGGSTGEAAAPVPTAVATAEAGAPRPMDQCPMHPPMGAQGCCGATPCVGAGCTKQCPQCVPCAGQVCCVSTQGAPDEQKHAIATVSCAPDTASCGAG